MTQIKDALIDMNPWWKEEYSINFKDRNIYQKIQKYLQLPQIISFTGLRRVGKTTLMKKIIYDSIIKGFEKQNIIYFSFDEFKKAELKEIISEYEKIMGNDFKKGKFILLLDEIQKLEGFEDKLKSVYDQYTPNLKIIISGSESLYIRKKSKETLAGRIFEFIITPLNFQEFLSFKEAKYTPLGLHEKELRILFDEFVLSMGFPEIVGIKDKDIIKKYIKESIIEKTLFRDMVFFYKIKDISVLESVVNILMNEPGQMIELNSLAGDLGISRQTLSNYLRYLEESFFLRKIYNFSKNRRKIERKLKKYYPIVVSPDLLFKEDDQSKSRIFEWFIVSQLNTEFFYRDVYKNEVDIILTNDKIIPVEIKFGKIDYQGVLAFMDTFKVNEGVIISYEKEESKLISEKKIKVIPAFKFLLEYKVH